MPKRQRRLISVVSLLLVAGFLVTSLTSFFASRASLRTQIAQSELPLTSDNIYSEIQRDLLQPIFISSLMATDTFVRDWVLHGEQDDARMTRYLQEIRAKYHTVTSFFVSDRTSIYYHADGILKKVSPNEPRDVWYYRVRQMKDDFEINVDPDMANRDTMTVFINYRVLDYDGHFIGATGVGLTVSAVKKLIEDYQTRYSRRIYFVDKEGVIRLHGTQFPDHVENIHEMPGLRRVAEKVLAQPAGVFVYTANGKTIHLNTRYISEFKWYLLVEQEEDQALRGVFHILLANLIICGVVIAVTLTLTNLTIASYQKTIELMATTDKLTGAYNRRALDVLFREAVLHAERSTEELSAILVDIDRFKKVNDRFGHAAGDSVLKDVVKTMSSHIRASDVLCRWGGEEFLILLKGCSLEQAFKMAEKLRLEVERFAEQYEGKEIKLTISLGVAQHHAGESEDNLLRRADQALYKAKRNGRNRVEKEGEGTD